jgi:Asp-tRNA(Asn)/Glu-tRNA(Gln) amidotransferase A subunit family amidase
MVANTARPLGWSAISVLGPMGRDVADTALLMAASVGQDARDPLSIPVSGQDFLPLPEVDLSTLRIGYTEDFGMCAVDAGIRRVFRQRMQALAGRVARCEPWRPALGDADRSFDVLRAEAFLAAFGATYQRAPETLGPNVRANVEMAARITLADRAEAHLAQTRLSRQFAAAFDHFDLLVSPVSPVSPFPWTTLYATTVDGQAMATYYQWLGLTYVVTLATNPALSLPSGRDEAGMPFGLQLIGRLNGDTALLAAAQAVERAFAADAQLARPRPDLARLAQPCAALREIVTHPPLPEGDGQQAHQAFSPV